MHVSQCSWLGCMLWMLDMDWWQSGEYSCRKIRETQERKRRWIRGCFLLRKCKRQTIPTNRAYECHTSATNYFSFAFASYARIFMAWMLALMKTIRKISHVRCRASWLAAHWIEVLRLIEFFFSLPNFGRILLHKERFVQLTRQHCHCGGIFFIRWHEFENASICLRKICRTHLPKIVLIHRGINSLRRAHSIASTHAALMCKHNFRTKFTSQLISAWYLCNRW